MNIRQLSTKITALTGRSLLDVLVALLFVGAIIKLISLNFSINVDDGNWDKFKIEHHCALQKSGYGVQQASWLCDDGKTYYRWRQQR